MNKEELNSYISAFQFKEGIPEIRSGYTITVSERITEGKKSRIQKFQGIVISNHHKKRITHNVLLRKKLDEFWIEKRFFLHSPLIEEIKIDNLARTRRANLYYLRNYRGLTERLRRMRKRIPVKSKTEKE
ncbi:50S ribosomal protein L19 [Candidatus Mycoplasma haematohominis]|uniref:50S ribosomal protein L19 n=1 Tax=Candidatus Mycoplasma haematohominis TaxID=1494318 RepID=A0A478FSA6_9MOLU|nr:50S ribosomal protein L19 [Candidatus Mycoplasma haemohominis]GCE63339.1 50S ribosomal protein L19 [Candidatus Mycoplasma haemohominis]